MLDIKKIRENPDEVKRQLLKRMDEVDFTDLLKWDELRRGLIGDTEALKETRNHVSAEIPKLKKQGADVESKFAEMRRVSNEIKALDERLHKISKQIHDFLSHLPNIPAEDVPTGGKEANIALSDWGEKPNFPFKPKDHVDLVQSLGLVDYDRGVKMGGNGFWLYRGMGARLEWGLLNYFIEEHIRDGYEFVLPPHLLSYHCGYSSGQFPKFKEDVFYIKKDAEEEERQQFLLPTSETALISLHRDEILKEQELPKKYFAYTPCFRREAGSYRAQERGMIRGHQFNKVELFQFTRPEDSESALKELLGKAERLVQGLGLHYRSAQLAAKDISASMAKTYDVEVWIPSMDEYKEVSSASNARDYQARRANIKFKKKDKKKEFVHTLNASGLATSRLLPAILEQHQQKDGTVAIPTPLQKWIGCDVLKPQ